MRTRGHDCHMSPLVPLSHDGVTKAQLSIMREVSKHVVPRSTVMESTGVPLASIEDQDFLLGLCVGFSGAARALVPTLGDSAGLSSFLCT